jgi:molybdopterin-guanine dinucleotide biosynthesis protein MobB
MESPLPFKIISVTGAHSGVGKTTLCSILLEDLEGFGAVKFTKTSLYTSVVDDEKTLGEPGKDTAMYLEAGAERVVWVQSPGGDELENALHIALAKMSGLKGVIIEGNSPLDFLVPQVVIFIIDGEGQMKSSSEKACRKADIVVINSERHIKDSIFSSEILREDTKVFRIDLVNKKGEIDKFLAYVRQYVQ